MSYGCISSASMTPNNGRVALAQIADEVVAIWRGRECPLEQPFEDCGWIGLEAHDVSSFDSTPSHNPSRTRRDCLSARSPAVVTVK